MQTCSYPTAPPWRAYFELCKPRVVALIVFTALVGMLLAVTGTVPLLRVAVACLGIALAASAAAALNHLVDRRVDAAMSRTAARPLPSGQVNPRHALAFAILLGALSMLILGLWINVLTALLTFVSLIGYAVIYTLYLKHATPQNIVIGGAAGAAPPVLGWCAMTGNVDPHALLLFAIIFVWTPPHFWALAIARRDEYAKVGIPMLPVTHGVAFTRLHVLLYTILLYPVTVLPYLTGMTGLIYLIAALLLGAVFLYYAVRLYRTDDNKIAMRTFAFSIVYLSALFAFLLVDHYWRLRPEL